MEERATAKDHAGMQIRVWISEDVYDLLKARARHHGTSVAEEARRLMQLGLAEGMTWEQFDASLDHLERLAYDTAVNARLLTKVEESRARMSFKQQQGTGQPDDAVLQRFRRQWGELRHEASEALTRYLQAEEGPEGEE